MKLKKNAGQWVAYLLLGICLVGVYELFENMDTIGGVIGKFLSILTPFIVGFAIAFVLYGPVKKLDDLFHRCKWKWVHRIARPVSVLIVYVITFALIALFVYAVLPAVARAVTDFAKQLPSYSNKVMNVVKQISEGDGWLANLELETKIQELYNRLETWLKEMITPEKLVGYLSGVLKIATSIFDIILALIVSVYMLLSKEALVRSVKSLGGLVFSPKTMSFFSEYLHKTAKIFYNYFYSQVLDALVVSVLATIGFLLAKLPNAPVLGIMLGLMNLIPYFGALIGGVLCVLVALLSGNFYGALFVAVYILVMQQIDANIIQPRIVGQNVGLRPLYVLLGITVGGGLFGFWGIILGVPAVAVLQMLINDYIASREPKAETEAPLPEPEPESEQPKED